MTNPKTPASLSRAGKALWKSVADKYELRPDEMETLLGAARAADMIAALRKAWNDAGNPMLTRGSMGQDVIHPLIGELRTQEAQKAALLAKLKLPDEATPGESMNQNRDAAKSSWAPGVRRGA